MFKNKTQIKIFDSNNVINFDYQCYINDSKSDVYLMPKACGWSAHVSFHKTRTHFALQHPSINGNRKKYDIWNDVPPSIEIERKFAFIRPYFYKTSVDTSLYICYASGQKIYKSFPSIKSKHNAFQIYALILEPPYVNVDMFDGVEIITYRLSTGKTFVLYAGHVSYDIGERLADTSNNMLSSLKNAKARCQNMNDYSKISIDMMFPHPTKTKGKIVSVMLEEAILYAQSIGFSF